MSQRINRMVEVVIVALLSVIVAAVVRTVCHTVFNEAIPYTPFYPAIVASTMYGRLPGGLLATCMAAFAASFWLSPFGQPLIQEPTDLIGLFLFLAVSGLVVGLCEAMRRAQEVAENALEEHRRAVVRERAARLEAEEANRQKDQFLASASHELRTPLQAILGWTQLLAQPDLDRQDRAQGLEIIERNARLQSRLIEDMLDLSRIVAGKMRLSPRLINPKQPIDAAIETVAIAAQAKQISIVRCYEDGEPALWADPDRLQQVIWNLLSNSIKFSPSGSTVRVTLRHERAGLEIEVSDEGEGVDSEFLPHLFERFRQADIAGGRRKDGLGLGLSIVKHLVELHGGTIRASCAGPGKGLLIQLSLPVADETFTEPTADQGRPTGQKPQLRGVRILVVEDDSVTCEMIARILQERQSEVVAVTSVDRAIEALQDFDPDVIVSDIAMPQRDGYELLRQVRVSERSRRRVPAVALTALSGREDRRRAFEAGYQLHLTKPVDSSALTEAVAGLVLR